MKKGCFILKKVEKISKENFPKAVKYAYSLSKKRHADFLAQNIVLPLGSILFGVHALILILGVAYEVVTDNNTNLAFFDTFSFIPDYCHKIWGFFGEITDVMFLKIVMFFALLYLVPFVVCGIISFIIRIFTKGQKPVIEGSDAKRAKQLYSYIDNAPANKTDAYDAQIIWCRITGISFCALLAAFIIHSVISTASVFTQKDTEWWLYAIFVAMVLIGCALLYITYFQMYFVLNVIIKPFYSSEKKWEEFKAEADRYWVSLDLDERKKRIKEELRKKDEEYDGWKYSSIRKTEYYKSKFNENYAKYTGTDYETDEEWAKRIVRDVEDDLSGKGYGDY